MGTLNHLHTKQMGFAAAQRLQMAKTLGGTPGGGAAGNASPMVAPVNPAGHPGDYRQHVAQATGLPGVSGPEVHGAIGALTQAGQLSPVQAHALVVHQGPLHGPGGAQTVGKIAQAVKMLRARRAAAGPPQGPQMAPQGALPPGIVPPGVQ
jgi:hypothetical protein